MDNASFGGRFFMRIQIKSLTRADRFKCKFGIFNLLLRFGDNTVRLKRGSLSALSNLKFYPRINAREECRAEIGDFCEFAETQILLGGEHPKGIVHSTFGSSYEIMLSQAGTDFMPTTKGITLIDPCCVFGVRTTILSGTQIGHNSIIGAGTIANGTYEKNSVITGAPGRKIKNRLTEKQFTFIEKHPWWTASYDWIINSIKDIQAEKVPRLPFEPDPHAKKFLVIRLGLEDARITGTTLEGMLIENEFLSKEKMPTSIIKYLDSFDGTGAVEIDTNIMTKCF